MNPKRKWTEEDRENLRKKHESGKTLAILAQEHGVSRQRIAQLIGGTGDKYYPIEMRSKYPRLNNWMVSNRITYAHLCSLMGYGAASGQARIRDLCQGRREPRKRDIDKLILISGLSYEELFAEVV